MIDDSNPAAISVCVGIGYSFHRSASGDTLLLPSLASLQSSLTTAQPGPQREPLTSCPIAKHEAPGGGRLGGSMWPKQDGFPGI